MSQQQKENYGYVDYDTNVAPALFSNLNNTQSLQTGCPDCPLIYAVQKDRTPYDKYWLQFYNNKAANTNYDLINLQFDYSP